MAKTVEELKEKLEKNKRNGDQPTCGGQSFPPIDEKLIGGDMGLAAVSILHDMIHDAVIKENTLHAALMIASNAVKTSWPGLDPEKFELNSYSLADFADADMETECKIFEAAYAAKNGLYYISAYWKAFNNEENHAAGAIGIERKCTTFTEDKTPIYWRYDQFGKPQKISQDEFFEMPEVLFIDKKSDNYGIRQFAATMEEKYERLTSKDYLREKENTQTQGVINLLNILADHNLEADICEVYAEGRTRYAVTPLFAEGYFAVTYINDGCYPVVYYNEYRDITTTVFISKSIQEIIDFWSFAAKIMRCVTAGGSCYPLSANVIEVFDEDDGCTHKFKDERKTLTDHEAMLSQIIHAAQEYEEDEE